MTQITFFDIFKKVLSYYKFLLIVFLFSFFSLYFYFSSLNSMYKGEINVQENSTNESQTIEKIVYIKDYFLKQSIRSMESWFDSNKILFFSNYVKFITNENIKSEVILKFFEENKIEKNYENLQDYKSNLKFIIQRNLSNVVTDIKIEFTINDSKIAKNFLEFFLLTSNKNYLEQNLDKTLYILESKLSNQEEQITNLENIQFKKDQIIKKTLLELKKLINIEKYQSSTFNSEKYSKTLAENLGIIEENFSNMSINDEVLFINNLINLNKFDLLNESFLYDKYYLLEKRNILLSGYIDSALEASYIQNQELEKLIYSLNYIKNNYIFHNYDKILNPVVVKLISFSSLIISIIISFAIILIFVLAIIVINNYKDENN